MSVLCDFNKESSYSRITTSPAAFAQTRWTHDAQWWLFELHSFVSCHHVFSWLDAKNGVSTHLPFEIFYFKNLTESIAGKLLSVELQFVSLAGFVVRFKTVSSGAHLSTRQFVSLCASCWLGAMQSAMPNNVTVFAALPCTLSVQLQSVNSAVLNTVCFVSWAAAVIAAVQSICSSVFCCTVHLL